MGRNMEQRYARPSEHTSGATLVRGRRYRYLPVAAAAIRSIPLYIFDLERVICSDEEFLRALERLMPKDRTLTLPNPNACNPNAILTACENQPRNPRV
jgi:aminoglycoside phosphotransferase